MLGYVLLLQLNTTTSLCSPSILLCHPDLIIIPPVSLFVLCVGIFFAYPIIYLHQFEEQVIFRALDLEALDGGAPVSPIAHLLRGSTWS